MAAILPPVPRFVFAVFEPLSLLAGFLAPCIDTAYFVRSQIPSSQEVYLLPTERLLALQLGNMYALVGMIGVGIMYGTCDLKLVRNFLVACAIGDVGHVYFTYIGMGPEFWQIAAWTATTWGNIAVTLFLFITRIAYFLGFFDRIHVKTG